MMLWKLKVIASRPRRSFMHDFIRMTRTSQIGEVWWQQKHAKGTSRDQLDNSFKVGGIQSLDNSKGPGMLKKNHSIAVTCESEDVHTSH